MVLTGLPKTLNAEILLGLLDEHFPCSYDYVYLPKNVERFESNGLAYINFREHEKAAACRKFFSGFRSWPGHHASARICRAEWSSIQGLEANIEKHQRRNWAKINIPEDCKPMVFDENGKRLPTMAVFFLKSDELAPDASSYRQRYVSRWEEDEKRRDSWRGSREDSWESTSRCTWQNSWDEERAGGSKKWQKKVNEDSSLETAEGVPTLLNLENLIEDSSMPEVKTADSAESHAMRNECMRLSDKTNIPMANEKPLSALAMIKYACPRCRKGFRKWSACHAHILNESQCRKEWGQIDSLALQSRCSEVAKDLDQEQSCDLAIVTLLRLQ